MSLAEYPAAPANVLANLAEVTCQRVAAISILGLH